MSIPALVGDNIHHSQQTQQPLCPSLHIQKDRPTDPPLYLLSSRSSSKHQSPTPSHTIITMGIIKTAMMSGVAIYGVKQLAQTAQTHNNNRQAPRYDHSDRSSDRNYDPRRVQPMEFRDPDPESQRYVNGQGAQRSNEWEPRQPLHLTDERSLDRQPYYMQDGYDELPQYQYTSNRRSSSAPAQNYQYYQQRQQGFVEPGDMYDPREPQRGNGGRGDMINSLAQQAMSMGLGGGKKDKNGSGDFLSGLMKK